jgi:ACR3 family arsenite efflux pump ArsB
MLGMMQIMIWLLCVYLIFKGIEIFQIAWMSARESRARAGGIILGIVMIGVACAAALVFVFLEEQMASQISDSQKNLPNFNFNR